MFDYIYGVVVERVMPHVVVESNGIGYAINVPLRLYYELDVGRKVKIYTRFVFGREKISLYGFSSRQEREFFDVLRKVPNVGSKSALSVLSFFSFDELKEAVKEKKRELIEKIPGVGPKKAARIIMELGEVVKKSDEKAEHGDIKQSILDTLFALGYKRKEVEESLHSFKVSKDESFEVALKRFLSEVGRNRRRYR